MNKFFKIFFITAFGILLSNCHKNDDVSVIPLADYTAQTTTDMAVIVTYLKTHTYTVDADYNVTFAVATDQAHSMWGAGANHGTNILERTYHPPTAYGGISYTIYYIKLNQGSGDIPCNVDSVLASYKGTLIDPSNVETVNETVFDLMSNPKTYFYLPNTIRGWSEIFPQFNAAATSVNNSDGSTTNTDFGAGIVFIPSALAYYNNGSGLVPSYTPIKFTFKLYKVIRSDNDSDGIPSYQEDLNNDHYIYTSDTGDVTTDDTDGDGIPDIIDNDDDNDGYLTKTELRYTDSNNVVRYYPYDGALTDDPATPFDDTKGAPDCSGNYTSATRLRKYRDPGCH